MKVEDMNTNLLANVQGKLVNERQPTQAPPPREPQTGGIQTLEQGTDRLELSPAARQAGGTGNVTDGQRMEAPREAAATDRRTTNAIDDNTARNRAAEAQQQLAVQQAAMTANTNNIQALFR